MGRSNEWHVLAITQAICRPPQAAEHRGAALPRRRHACAVRAPAVAERAGGAGGQRRRPSCWRRPASSHRRRPCHWPSSNTTVAVTGCAARRWHRHDAVPQPAARWRLQIQPTAWRAGGRRRHGRHPEAPPTRISGNRACRACMRKDAESALAVPALTHVHNYLQPSMSSGPGAGHRFRRDPRGRHLQLGVDPLGGAGVDYWPAIAEHYKPAADGCQQMRWTRSFAVHDAGLGRQDPHGPVVALGDAAADAVARQASTWPLPATPTMTATASSRAAPA